MSDRPADLMDALKAAVADLQWMSESDYPFEVFYWTERSPLTPQKLLELTQHPADAPVETADFDEFFAVATEPQDWHSSTDQQTVRQYQNLVKLLKTCLTDLTVYRVGSINLDIYIIGKTSSGELAGIATKAVET